MPRKKIELIVIYVLIVGIIGYAGTNILYSSRQVDSAEVALTAAVSHQNNLNTSFGDISTQVTALNSNATFDSQRALALVDRSISNSQLAMKIVKQDDTTLRASERDLHSRPWLTVLSSKDVDSEASRVAHARAALAAASAIAAGEMLDGRFWRALYAAVDDIATLSSKSSYADPAGTRSTLAKMNAEIDQAAGLASAPGLPTELRSLAADVKTFIVDYGKRLDAEAAGDDAGAQAAASSVQADVSRMAAHDIDKIGAEIAAYYKPLVDRFNSEMAAATANQTS